MPTWLSLLLVGVGVLGAVVLLLWIYDETACPRWARPIQRVLRVIVHFFVWW